MNARATTRWQRCGCSRLNRATMADRALRWCRPPSVSRHPLLPTRCSPSDAAPNCRFLSLMQRCCCCCCCAGLGGHVMSANSSGPAFLERGPAARFVACRRFEVVRPSHRLSAIDCCSAIVMPSSARPRCRQISKRY